MNVSELVIRGGRIYDGSGGIPYEGDVWVRGDVIAGVGDVPSSVNVREIDARGLAVAPGFINMMSWSCETLIEDGRSQSEIRQGVTLEVMGEGRSMGPMNDVMKAEFEKRGFHPDIHYPVEWTTLGEYLEWLAGRGISPNVASFVGSSTVRIHAMGYDDRPASAAELERMRGLVREAMQEGAVGLSSALIYPPATYSSTDELISLACVASEYDGLYASHIRSESGMLLDALDEFLEIARRSGIRAEVYHLKASGPSNWDKLDDAIAMIERARSEGFPITADMYPYAYSGRGLDSCIPPWAHDGGFDALLARLSDPDTRSRIRAELLAPATGNWENAFFETGPERILLAGFRNEVLKRLAGRTLADVATERAMSPADVLMDLIVEDASRMTFAMFFSMSEENVRKQAALPWMSFCSDAESQAPEGVFMKSSPHPRAYGAFARVLGRYVREERILTLEEAIRRMTSLPADSLRLKRRGRLRSGEYADLVVFDPNLIKDHATPTDPHRYATGMVHVLVNGTPVLEDGEHTGALPGRVVRGPGWRQ
ncbi:N-acyl-D-amino-acid deacylase family protein [Streptomyces sp. NPDC004752]